MDTLELNLLGDLKHLLSEQFRRIGYPFDEANSPKDFAQAYYDLRIRQIEPRPRRVHVSRDLASKDLQPIQKTAVSRIMQFAERGVSLEPFQSKYLRRSSPDLLLYDWKLHHLHLGLKPDHSEPGFVARTDALLFLRVEDEDIYLVDVRGHSAFSYVELLEIVYRNWPDLLARGRLNGVKGPNPNPTNEQIENARNAGVMACVGMPDGTAYTGTGGGYASAKNSIWATMAADKLLSHLGRWETIIRENEPRIRSEIAGRETSAPTHLKLQLIDYDESGVTVKACEVGIVFKFNEERTQAVGAQPGGL